MTPASASVTATDPAAVAGELRVAVARLGYALRRPGLVPELTASRHAALALLAARGPLRARTLAEAMAIAKPTLTRLLDALAEQGWAVREPDPHDGRATLVSITAEGRGVLDRLRTETTSALCEDIAALSEGDRQRVAAVVPLLARLAEQQLARAANPLT